MQGQLGGVGLQQEIWKGFPTFVGLRSEVSQLGPVVDGLDSKYLRS